MTPSDKLKLVDDLIKFYPGSTVKDYAAAVIEIDNEVKQIQNAMYLQESKQLFQWPPNRTTQ